MSERIGKAICSECGTPFTAQSMAWDSNNSGWTHRCDARQETAKEYLMRTDKDYREQQEKSHRGGKR
jgi:hypothetical protein